MQGVRGEEAREGGERLVGNKEGSHGEGRWHGIYSFFCISSSEMEKKMMKKKKMVPKLDG